MDLPMRQNCRTHVWYPAPVMEQVWSQTRDAVSIFKRETYAGYGVSSFSPLVSLAPGVE